MKRMLGWLGVGLVLLVNGWADGLIIVRDPDALSHPILPPSRPRPPQGRLPPMRPYVFAPLEVSYHHVKARIADPIAVTSVDQEFYNPNPRQLEGTYLFPVPPGAQIDKFTMEINGQPVEAELLAADQARKIYEDIAFILDTSGSMAGAKLNQAKKALEFCVENLNEGDRFEIIRFSTETEPLFNRLTEVTVGTKYPIRAE